MSFIYIQDALSPLLLILHNLRQTINTCRKQKSSVGLLWLRKQRMIVHILSEESCI